MTSAAWIAVALAAIVAFAGLRATLTARRQSVPAVPVFVRVAGMIASAVLLYFFLQPPAGESRAVALKLLTADARPEDATAAADEIVLALPEAPAFANVARVPDLGTALRRHASAGSLRIRGNGLEARDLDAAVGRRIEFTPPPLPSGLVELSAPTGVNRGRRFTVQGRVAGADGGRIDLLDPAGRRADVAELGEDGRFRLQASAGPVGRVDFRLQVRTDDDTLETLSLPLDVQTGVPLRVWVLAGGPSPELKYLRRWALDAGLALRTQVAVGGGVDIGDPPLPVTAATLREFDLVVIDDRAWRDLGDRGRATLREAVRDGLGLLLRLTADPGESERGVLRDWGFSVEDAELTRSVRLPGSEAPDPAAATAASTAQATDQTRATDTAPLLSRRPLRLQADDGLPLQRDERGETLALWRNEGRGRVALWALSDSFRLVLAGRRTAHGSLWAQAFDTLARPEGEPPPALPEAVRVGGRSVFCDLGDEARVIAPDGKAISQRLDPASGGHHCAAWWPTTSGWHELQSGGRSGRFHVRGVDEGRALAAVARQQATLALMAAPATSTGAGVPAPGPRWPWGLAWLLVSTALWWMERPRR